MKQADENLPKVSYLLANRPKKYPMLTIISEIIKNDSLRLFDIKKI